MSNLEQQTKPDGGASVSTAGLGGIKSEWFKDSVKFHEVVRIAAAEAQAAKAKALDAMRVEMAETSAHYRRESRRFGASESYATAANMEAHAEAYAMLCMAIGRALGMTNVAALKVEPMTPNVKVTGAPAHGD